MVGKEEAAEEPPLLRREDVFRAVFLPADFFVAFFAADLLPVALAAVFFFTAFFAVFFLVAIPFFISRRLPTTRPLLQS